MARLDRLGTAKEVAQVGAAIGREFSHAFLAAVVRKSELDLLAALDRLMESGLLFRQGVPPHATYLFKHALVQDAAYGTLLREPRRALHARIAEALETQFADVIESRPELLARHCTEAGQIERAAGLWGKAGQRSLERSALVEAIEQLTLTEHGLGEALATKDFARWMPPKSEPGPNRDQNCPKSRTVPRIILEFLAAHVPPLGPRSRFCMVPRSQIAARI
jgi:predicted ATPase